MNKDALLQLKEKIMRGLSNLSSLNYSFKNIDFDIYINAYILLTIKLNPTLIHDFNTILKSIPHQIDKPNIINITNGLSQLGYVSRQSRGCSTLEKLTFPCLLIKGSDIDNHVRVLFRENQTTICYDPFNDSYSAFDALAIDKTYLVYTFEPFAEERFDLSRGVLKFLGRSWFVALLARFRYVIGKLVLISIVLHLFSLVMPLYLIYTYNRVIVSHDTSNLMVVTVSVICLLLCEQLLRYFRAGVLSWLGSRVDYIVTHEVLNKLNQLPLPIIEKLSLPSQIARIRSFSSVRDFFTGPIFSTLLELPAIVLMIILISYFHYLFTVIFAAGFLLLAICLVFFHRILAARIKKNTLINTEKYYLTAIYLDKLNTLHYQGLERYYTRKLNGLSEQATYYNLKAELASNFVDNYGKWITNMGILITLCTGIYLVWSNQITVDILLATVFLSWRIFSPIQVASSTMVRSEKLYRTIQQIDNFLDLPDEYDAHSGLKKTIEIKKGIRLANIGVFYNANKQFVLKNFSMDIRLRQLIAITGESGSGKSTLLKLITGFIKPNIGKVLIDDYEISQLNIHSLRNQICYIHQSENIIQGTIYDNIQMVNPYLTREDVDDLFDSLFMGDEVSKLAEGLNTYISADNPGHLSKKWLKYMAIVKLYASNAAIKLIDGLNKDAFSAKTWHKFLTDLQQWRHEQTIVMVTDDDQIRRMADKTITLKSKLP
ncbi:ATP-binding cassette domain-containing protein [Legionella sp. MW5194]|uniref:ATP-binding cassette domain-containing protein n=1 Tax=Legionella sp. MW5194 TaxID=2662448 RepID=UPI00193D4EE1|nr:ATP-binding cassette domain-containing protein [Legionella sp. MW5194]QRN03595.1 ATP-binding cassette domain-containing protein [Legionella sp. MW5194]